MGSRIRDDIAGIIDSAVAGTVTHGEQAAVESAADRIMAQYEVLPKPVRSTGAEHGEPGHVCASNEEWYFLLRAGEFFAAFHGLKIAVSLAGTAMAQGQEFTRDALEDLAYATDLIPKWEAFHEQRIEEERVAEEARQLAQPGIGRVH